MNRIRGVIFDMDGLMFDTERMFTDAWPGVCAQFGLEYQPQLAASLRGSNGAKSVEIIHRFYPEADGAAMIAACYNQVQARLLQGVPKKKGLDELLAYLKGRGLPMAIGSSTKSPLVKRNLNMAGVAGYFSQIAAGEMVTLCKPAPELFLLAAKLLDLPPQNCLVLEDSFNGVRAGRAAGCITVMVPDLSAPTQEILALCDGCCEDLEQVIGWIEQRERTQTQ